MNQDDLPIPRFDHSELRDRDPLDAIQGRKGLDLDEELLVNLLQFLPFLLGLFNLVSHGHDMNMLPNIQKDHNKKYRPDRQSPKHPDHTVPESFRSAAS